MKTVFKTTGGKDPVKDSSSTYAAGDVIFRQGELGTEMFILQEGEVNVVKHINGESHTLSHLEKGDFFGEMAVLESVPRTADAIAATDVRALVINGARFDEMLRKNPEVAVRIIRKYSKRLREAMKEGPMQLEGIVEVDEVYIGPRRRRVGERSIARSRTDREKRRWAHSDAAAQSG